MLYYFILACFTVTLFMLVSVLPSGQDSNQRIVSEKSLDIMLANMLQAHWMVMLAGGVTIAIFTLLISHRIAGPHYRFGKTFEAMLAKNLSQDIWLRARDEVKPLAI